MGLEKNTVMRRVEKKNQAATSAPEEVSKEQTIDEILKDDSQGFGEFLDSYHSSALDNLAIRLREGKPKPADMPRLVQLHKEYTERKKNGERIVGTLNEYIDEMIRESPALKDLTDSFGEANVRGVVEQGLRELAVKDPRELARIAARYQDLADFDKDVDEPLTKRIKDFCDKHKVNDDAVIEALNNPDARQRLNGVQAALRANLTTGGQRFRDTLKGFIGFGTKRKANTIASVDLDSIRAQRDALLQDGGNFMRALIESRRPEMHEALMNIAIGKEPAFKEGFETKTTFEEMKEMLKMKETFTKASTLERAREYRKAMDGADWTDKDTRDMLTQNFYDSERIKRAEFKGKRGFFARLAIGLATIFNIDKKAKTEIEAILQP